ncbi:MAG: translation initiation factor IF-2 [Bacteroidetes bacterium]|nr:translation initiation factor IF-2 [Bacteroidota bacterium]MBP6427365.1 translation initiation factor IF-2 [Bacteroidia bacterium]MBK8363893.1 translation initiation factor IF-2 [Bacteroidota bacterium]MBK9415140.1 translation initiation factor IF-2 [Bacteroidota bacterium]MBL0031581.1 translation initiation factor IF-2 [Bacteroidota bacterium]
MAEVEKTFRLSKAIKEFNLSLDHIVDFLTKKGFKVESNPNTKLPGDAYALLLKEFQGDKSAKEEAQQLAQNKMRKETVILDAQEKPKAASKKDDDSSEILIKNVGAANAQKEEAPKAKKEEAPKAKKEEVPASVIKAKADKVEGPKVVGMIDIDGDSKKKKTVKDEVPAEDTKEEKAKKTAAKKKKDDDDAAAKVVADAETAAVEKAKKATKEVKAVTPKTEEQPPAPVMEKAPEPVVTPPAPEVKEVVAEKTPEAPAPAKTDEPPASDQVAGDDIHRIKRTKLSGPTIMGKIELPVDPPKRKPVASSTGSVGDKDKKKRKRTDRKGTPVPQDKSTRPPGAPGSQAPGSRPPFKPGGRNPNYKGNNPNNRPPGTPGENKTELTEKQIQDQIKATLARLSGGGKSRSSKMRKARRDERNTEKEAQAQDAAENRVIQVTEFVTANDLARLMDKSVTEIISACMSLGMFVSINQRLDAETLTVVAEEFGYTVEFVSADVQETIGVEEDKPEDIKPRSPIVTVMGHVDHGKTSLLDYIRKANVIAGEAGGITQHIGAYEVQLENGKKITFLDTPGHEAFTAMRARGAKVTDVAIIVIAADDSVMPQTIEAINHAQAAGVPMVFAINKVDKPDSNPERIREQLSKMNILVEDWGGKYQCQEISAKKGQNIEALLEKVLLEAEMLDLKANANRRANGTVIESMLDKGRGYVMTVLVQGGTLKVGDILLAGCYSGRVKALYNERGFRIKEAGPSAPAQVLGMTGAPQAGDLFNVMEDEREARDIANKRLQLQREQGIRTHKHITLDEIGRRLAIGNFKELNVIVKGDVDGSIEALADSLLKLSNPEIQINIIHKSVGAITESDVLLASASNAIIIGFQVRPSVNARKLAESEEIEIRLYSIIYTAINEIKLAMEGMLAPEFQEKIVGNIEIRETFKIPKIGTIAGCMVLDGKISRNTKIRVVRDGIVVYSGELASLKRFKDDVKEVSAGYECGLSIHNFNDIQINDIIEGYEQVAVKRTLA